MHGAVDAIADLRVRHLRFGKTVVVRQHGKGDKSRTCTLWHHTAQLLAERTKPPTVRRVLDSAS